MLTEVSPIDIFSLNDASQNMNPPKELSRNIKNMQKAR